MLLMFLMKMIEKRHLHTRMQSSGAGSLKFSGVKLQEDNRRKKATPSGITSDETTANDFKVADVSGNKDGDNPNNKDDKNDSEIKVNFSLTASPKVTANINVADVLDENDGKVTSSYKDVFFQSRESEALRR